MKINYKKTISKVAHFLTFKGSSFNPERDWRIIFLMTCFLFFASLLFHVVFFYKVNDESIFRSNIVVEDSSIEIDIEKLDDAFAFFEVKKQRFDIIREKGVSAIDPSL